MSKRRNQISSPGLGSPGFQWWMSRGRHRCHRYRDGGRVAGISAFCAGRSQRLRPAIGHPEAFIWLRPIRHPLDDEQPALRRSLEASRPPSALARAGHPNVRPCPAHQRGGGGGVVRPPGCKQRQPRAGPASRKAAGERGRQGRPLAAVGAPDLVWRTDLSGLQSLGGLPIPCSLAVGAGLRTCSLNYGGLMVSPQEPPMTPNGPHWPIKRV